MMHSKYHPIPNSELHKYKTTVKPALWWSIISLTVGLVDESSQILARHCYETPNVTLYVCLQFQKICVSCKPLMIIVKLTNDSILFIITIPFLCLLTPLLIIIMIFEESKCLQ